MQRCLIVDDERPAREELLYILENIENVQVVGEACHGKEALELNRKLSPDIIFLDIQMPGMSGIDVARRLLDENNPPIVIFVTAYDQFALEAFDVCAIDYLLKPISEDRIRRQIDRIEKIKSIDINEGYRKISKLIENISINNRKTQESPNIISVYKDNKLIPLDIKDILFATIEDKSTMIVSRQGNFEINCTLNKLIEKLNSDIFFRSHKSYIVNLNNIESVEPWFNSTYNINLKNSDEVIPVSRNYSKEFREIMNIE